VTLVGWRNSSCQGKVAFDSVEAAHEQIGRMRRRRNFRNRRASRLNAYRCQFCGSYHIGNTLA
jgi:hypothetical protein